MNDEEQHQLRRGRKETESGYRKALASPVTFI